MQHLLLAGIGCYAVCYSSYPDFSQQLTRPSTSSLQKTVLIASGKSKNELPDDLPQSKLLFIKYSPANVPAKRPDNMSRRQYSLLKNHNEVYLTANEQLIKAAAHYPFSYRITTQDSSTYYAQQGYKYSLFHTSFNAMTDGTYVGTSSNGYYSNVTTVKLFVQDLTMGNRYPVDTFSETFVYYYKGIVGKFLKKVNKQFDVKS